LLNKFNAQQQQQQQQQHHQQQPQPQQQQPHQQHHQQHDNEAFPVDTKQLEYKQHIDESKYQESMIDKWYRLYSGDIKLFALVFIVVGIAYVLPVNAIASSYIRVDMIPFSDVILRASIASIVIYILILMFRN
jgi:hypothetical protein